MNINEKRPSVKERSESDNKSVTVFIGIVIYATLLALANVGLT